MIGGATRSGPVRLTIQVPGASDAVAAAVTAAITAFLAQEEAAPAARVRPWERAARLELVGGSPISALADLRG